CSSCQVIAADGEYYGVSDSAGVEGDVSEHTKPERIAIVQEARQFIADVFWFSGEFGVVRQDGEPRAYGAGLLSSFGELCWFARHAELRPVDVWEMGRLPYDISRYQPVLFAAESLDHVLDEVGGFFDQVGDDDVAAHVAVA
ncbi:MAG: hypothetical protein ACERLM_13080, partial [Acidimicrobiales bacterium]